LFARSRAAFPRTMGGFDHIDRWIGQFEDLSAWQLANAA
jgi:hypothetical protein